MLFGIRNISSRYFSRIVYKVLKLPQGKRKILLSLSDLFTNYVALIIIYFSSILKEVIPINNFFYLGFITSLLIVLIYSFTGLYYSVARFSGSFILYNILFRNLLSLLFILPIIFIKKLYYIDFFLITNFIFISTTLTVSSRLILRDLIKLINKNKSKRSSALLYGFSDNFDNFFELSAEFKNFEIIAFVDHNNINRSRNINGLPIIRLDDLSAISDKVEYVIIDSEKIENFQIRNLYKFFKKYNIELLETTKPKLINIGISDSPPPPPSSLKPIKIEDILGRKTVPPLDNLMEKGIQSQVVLVTGAGGSIGSELSFEIMCFNPSKLILIDNNEHNLYKCHQRLLGQFKGLEKQIIPILCDVMRENCLIDIFEKYKINKVFHAAAYKHVPILETNYIEGLRNNIFSTYYLCKYAYKFNIGSLTLISSDKAVRSTSIMGASKRVSELIVQAFAQKSNQNKKNLLFSMVRFGNVLGSSGSVVPLFENQINKGGPITVTDPNVIRYFMTVKEAAQLVIQSSVLAEGGDLFLLDMGEPIKIIDLAKQMINLSGLTLKNNENPNGDIEIEFSGLRKGEKLYEELLIEPKSSRTIHPLIYKANETAFLGDESIWDILKELKLSLDLVEKDKSLDILKKLVPEFNFQSIK